MYTSVIIPLGNDNFAEIDMLIVSKFGIHVCEVKNRVGTITGNIRDKTLSVQAGNEVYEMENPFYQNSIHMNYIRTLLYNHFDDRPPHTRDFSRELGGFFLHLLMTYGII